MNDLSKNFKTYLYQGHDFTDSTSRLQLFYEGETTEYLTLWKSEDYSRDLFGAKETHLLQYEFALGSKQRIHQRNVYSTMDLLGDGGGIYGSMFSLGLIIHSLISSKSMTFMFHKYYFRVEPNEKFQTPMEKLLGSKPWKTTFCTTLMHSTILRYLLCCGFGQKKNQRLLAKTNKHLTKALDVRTILQM